MYCLTSQYFIILQNVGSIRTPSRESRTLVSLGASLLLPLTGPSLWPFSPRETYASIAGEPSSARDTSCQPLTVLCRKSIAVIPNLFLTASTNPPTQLDLCNLDLTNLLLNFFFTGLEDTHSDNFSK